MKAKKLLAAVLSAATVLCAVPITAHAAEATVQELDGTRTAFVSAFGRISYNGKTYTSYKTFDEALKALGTEGGTVVFNGTLQLGSFVDLAGRKGITFAGMGTKSQSNLLDFSGAAEVNLAGNMNLDFVNIRLDEGAYLLTNGFDVNTYNYFDTYHTEKYVANGTNIISYPAPPSIAVGSAENRSGVVTLTAGTYTTVAVGTVDGHTSNGDAFTVVNGDKAETLVAGSVGGTLNGNTKLTVNGGEYAKLVIGSAGGTLNGNVKAVLNGGTFASAVFGAESGATVNGSVILELRGGTFSGDIALGGGTVTGKKIVIADAETPVNLASGAADYILRTTGSLCEPQFDGTKVTGFLVSDHYGIPAENAVINGQNVSSANGIYTIPEGISTVSVPDGAKMELKRGAHYVAGYENGTFAPQNNMTKAEAVTLLARILLDEERFVGKVFADFKDVEAGAWYNSYIGLFQRMGLLDEISLEGGTRFGPNDKITRAEFTQLIYEVATVGGASDSIKLRSFSDIKENNKYRAAIFFAVSNNIVKGYDDGTFRPDNNITRAEVVTMVNRFLGRNPNGGEAGTSFSDVEGHWAKNQILAACGDENVTWTAVDNSKNEYVLSGTNYKDYVTGLYNQSENLSADAIRRGVDTVSEQMKKDILNTPNTKDLYGDRMTGTTYYISEKNGNDSNDGLSPETAVKTYTGLTKKMRFPKKGTSILFERGGIYRGVITLAGNGITLGSYGEGPKPLLMQSTRNYADPSLWVETQWENVWKCTQSLYNVGIIGFDHDLFDYSDASYDELYGDIMNYNLFGFKGAKDLSKDLQFYSVLENDPSAETKNNELYLYSDKGNPGSRFKSIEIGEKTNIISGASNDVVIDNLAFKFTGAHGMGSAGGCKDRVVTNCVFSWLGGSILAIDFRNSGKPVNYGNAVEIYGSCNGYRVENCWMYQIYDTAVTHQFSDGTACTQEGVRYYGLLMEYCYWAIEFYNALGDGKTNPNSKYTKDVHMAYNVSRTGGMGWGSKVRYRTGRLYCGSSLSKNEDELTEYNVFDRCHGYLLTLPANSNEVDDKNIYIQTVGEPLGSLKGTYVVCDYGAADAISKYWGDKNAVVIIIDPSLQNA